MGLITETMWQHEANDEIKNFLEPALLDVLQSESLDLKEFARRWLVPRYLEDVPLSDIDLDQDVVNYVKLLPGSLSFSKAEFSFSRCGVGNFILVLPYFFGIKVRGCLYFSKTIYCFFEVRKWLTCYVVHSGFQNLTRYFVRIFLMTRHISHGLEV